MKKKIFIHNNKRYIYRKKITYKLKNKSSYIVVITPEKLGSTFLNNNINHI